MSKRCKGCGIIIYFNSVNGKILPFEDPLFSQLHKCSEFKKNKITTSSTEDLLKGILSNIQYIKEEIHGIKKILQKNNN